MHQENCFVTLTYEEKHLPRFMSLRYRDFQLFMKRLRKFADVPIRFFMCGEYGGRHCRPHFHACIFGFNFSDRLEFKRGGGDVLYRSSSLENLWPLGFSTVGAVTFESAAYVARYVVDKINGANADAHYRSVDVTTGEVGQRVAEFCHMSLKPGIGRFFLEKFWKDVYPSGKVIVNGKEAKAPRYYDRLCNRRDSDEFAVVAYDRERMARKYFKDTSDDRLAAREAVAVARSKLSKREL